jgi:hypothetical protein
MPGTVGSPVGLERRLVADSVHVRLPVPFAGLATAQRSDAPISSTTASSLRRSSPFAV